MVNQKFNIEETGIEKPVEDILDGKAVPVPTKLGKFAREYSRKADGRDGLVLTYHFIRSCLRAARQQNKELQKTTKKVAISRDRFEAAIPRSRKSIGIYKKSLEENNFIKVDHFFRPEVKERNQTGQSKEYRPTTLSSGDLYYLTEPAIQVLEAVTADDPLSQTVRDNLNLVEMDSNFLNHILTSHLLYYQEKQKRGENKQKKPKLVSLTDSFLATSPTLTAAAQLKNKKGRVFRDKTGRLHSPFTQIPTIYRPTLTYKSKKLVGLDMRCCQPALTAMMSHDGNLLEDCKTDKLYGRIAEIAGGISRGDAKELYCKFAYGTWDEKPTANNEQKLKVQTLFEEEYPTTANFIKKNKEYNYKKFSHRMMKVESGIFIDGVLRKLVGKKIFALPLHDGIYCEEQNVELVKEEIAYQIKQKFPTITPNDYGLKQETTMEGLIKKYPTIYPQPYTENIEPPIW